MAALKKLRLFVEELRRDLSSRCVVEREIRSPRPCGRRSQFGVPRALNVLKQERSSGLRRSSREDLYLQRLIAVVAAATVNGIGP